MLSKNRKICNSYAKSLQDSVIKLLLYMTYLSSIYWMTSMCTLQDFLCIHVLEETMFLVDQDSRIPTKYLFWIYEKRKFTDFLFGTINKSILLFPWL